MIRMESDVIIVALGLSGMATAVAAAEQGLSVIGFEKSDVTGGQANMGMGPFAVESRVQRAAQVSLTLDEAYRKHMEITDYQADAQFVYKYYKKSADTIDWLMDMGVRFEVQRYFPHSECTAHNVLPEGGGTTGPRAASTMVKRLTERAEELGVQMMLQCPVKKILVEDGRPVGVLAVNAEGEEIEAYADAIVVATGGLGTNHAMIKEAYNMELSPNVQYRPIVGINGEGAKMAWEAGAGKSPLAFEWTCGISDNFNHMELEGAFRAKPDLLVNLNGERFINEDVADHVDWVARAILKQPQQVAFMIMDQARLDYLKKYGPEYVDQVHGVDMYNRFEESVRRAQEANYPDLHIADSIEELCEKSGINCENLKKTLAEYNHACATGRDDVLGKDPKYLFPVSTPKYYCCKIVLQTNSPSGGIMVNRNLEVLDPNGKVIPGFYAVGMDAAVIAFGGRYPMCLPGGNMGFCLNGGRICAENIASYLDALDNQ